VSDDPIVDGWPGAPAVLLFRLASGNVQWQGQAGDLDAVRPQQEVHISLDADDLDALLRTWLGELLYTFHTRKLVFSDFTVSVSEAGLQATARGEPMDVARHELDVEIKAVTWHGLKVQRTDEGWLAEVIVDI